MAAPATRHWALCRLLAHLLSPLLFMLTSFSLVFPNLYPWEGGLSVVLEKAPHVGFASWFLRIRRVDGLSGGNLEANALIPSSVHL